MDTYSERTSQDVPLSTSRGHVDGGLVVENSVHPAACVLCRRTFSPDNNDLEAISICGDCKFLLLEDLGDSTHDSLRRRRRRGGRTRYNSFESLDNLFSQQLLHMINLVRQNQSTVPGHEIQSVDGDASVRLLHHTSSLTTPTGSRRWRRVLSDTESEGFDNFDSPYGENETTPSASWYRHGDSDAISFSAYGGDSDVSVDGHSFLDTDMFFQPEEGSNLDSDTDIDPMHAGLNQWNSDDEEEEEEELEEDDGEWEEADIEEDTNELGGAGPQLQNLLFSSPNESNHSINRRQRFDSPEFESLIRWRIRPGRQTYNRDIFANLEEPELPQYVGNSRDYLDARGFEELLEHLAETDSSRRGAPPAAVSFVNSLPLVIVNEEHEKHDGLACAICKDVLSIGTEVNQLPCFHLYHPSCILPWLSARNSCPLCRFELPTDDKDYEEGKRSNSNRMGIHEIQQQDVSEDSSSDDSDGAEAHEAHEFDQGGIDQREVLDVDPAVNTSGREGSGRRWFFLAAAPIVGLVGIVLVYWLGSPQRRGPTHHCDVPQRGLHQIRAPGSSAPSQRGNRSRRWWSFF
ncbi:E3 ubiquitin-protein ligase Praja-2 [Ricinus communis]|uniref:RING-type E3 ubiquitin transferase n=1 Tax=Ricinus communis TaxID=3988 RepID=B9T0P5_RICCO|nr:E3 ubiquitin-protein ligase Praja-2 [Ricinus communis]EEF30571.1 zinc finger protein, putative [Ricinus communis]|eukprot:XP_002531814.1 E3 ubiquitin-protein ligase Praja-2 [Ricinus communis]